jgi:hypothetical protein
VGATYAFVTLVSQARADVLIRLQNGATIRARSYQIDGDTVKFDHHGGVVGFARETVVAIEDAAPLPNDAAPEKAADWAAATADAPHARAATRDSTLASDASTPGKENKDSHAAANPAASTDPDLALIAGEDPEIRMDRLDKLSLTTHRELTIARAQEQADEILDRLQHRIDEINRQRAETMQRLRASGSIR